MTDASDHDHIPELALDWHRAGRGAVLATVIETWGSAPRGAGSQLVVAGDGDMAGSVSGGCVEGAVIEEAMAARADGLPRLLTFGVSDEQAFAVGLACGGTIRVLVDPVAEGALSEAMLSGLVAARADRRAAALTINLTTWQRALLTGPVLDQLVLDQLVRDQLVRDQPSRDQLSPDHPVPDELVPDYPVPDKLVPDHPVPDEPVPDEPVPDYPVPDKLVPDELVPDKPATGPRGPGGPGPDRPGTAADHSPPVVHKPDIAARLRSDRSGVDPGPDGDVFVGVHNPPLRMIVVGAVHIAQPLLSMARLLGYDPVLIDPRSAFGSAARFPGETILDDWPDAAMKSLAPDARTAVVTLTHDPKLDDPAIRAALDSPAFYVGCLGSPRTHARRLDRLRADGVGEVAIARIHAPVGLDIGARTPAEIALSVLAQITLRLRRG